MEFWRINISMKAEDGSENEEEFNIRAASSIQAAIAVLASLPFDATLMVHNIHVSAPRVHHETLK